MSVFTSVFFLGLESIITVGIAAARQERKKKSLKQRISADGNKISTHNARPPHRSSSFSYLKLVNHVLKSCTMVKKKETKPDSIIR